MAPKKRSQQQQQGRQHGKRKTGHLGFQSNEIAFIEDEMAALAAEYGLTVDDSVAAHVDERRQAKKKARLHRRRPLPGGDGVSSSSSAQPAAVFTTKDQDQDTDDKTKPTTALLPRAVHVSKGEDADADAAGLIARVLRELLPEGVALQRCAVPGCSCLHRGPRELVLPSRHGVTIATERDVIQHTVCRRCQHGILQHSLVVNPHPTTTTHNSSTTTSHSHQQATGQHSGQRLLSALYTLIRVTRLSAATFRSRVWVASLLDLLNERVLQWRSRIAAGGSQNGQQTVSELASERALLLELQSLLQRAETEQQRAVARDETAIALSCVLDQMYFHCYYACLVVYGRGCAAVPAPHEYLWDLDSFAPETERCMDTFITHELLAAEEERSTRKEEQEEKEEGRTRNQRMSRLETLELAHPGTKSKKNKARKPNAIALLDVFHARLRDGVRLFYETGVGMQGEMDALLSNAGGVLSNGHASGSAPSSSLSNSAASSSSSSKKKHKAPNKKHFRRERRDTEAAATTSGTMSTTGNQSLVAQPAGGGGSGAVVPEMPAYELLAQWRNNCRDWCCHLYAYATPSDAALTVMAKYAPLIEVGAGTGYWSSLLQQRGVDILAYDVAPPSTGVMHHDDGSSSSAQQPSAFQPRKNKSLKHKQQARARLVNVYHGQVPTFCSVAQGGPEILRATPVTRALFLCYPPPQDTMALDCLRAFRGTYVIHVGEWQGDTGESCFEARLATRFALVEELELPNWGNSSYSLTVWKRRPRGEAEEEAGVARLQCFHCHDHQDAEDAEDDELAFRRCVLCKTNVYCSERCAHEDAVGHAAEHATRLVFLEDDSRLEFDNPLHYKPMRAMKRRVGDGGAEEEMDSEEEQEVAQSSAVVAKSTTWRALTGNKATTTTTTTTTTESASETPSKPAHTFSFF